MTEIEKLKHKIWQKVRPQANFIRYHITGQADILECTACGELIKLSAVMNCVNFCYHCGAWFGKEENTCL